MRQSDKVMAILVVIPVTPPLQSEIQTADRWRTDFPAIRRPLDAPRQAPGFQSAPHSDAASDRRSAPPAK